MSPNVGRNFDYPLMSFDENADPVYGVLATDRPHQLKAQVLFDFAFGTSVGLSGFGASGIPRTREAAFVPGNAFPVMYFGRDSDGRLPFLSQLARDARFLLDSGYQSPRSIRLEVKLGF